MLGQHPRRSALAGARRSRPATGAGSPRSSTRSSRSWPHRNHDPTERAAKPSQQGRRPLSFLAGGKFAPKWSGGHRPDGLMQVAGRRADPGEARSTAGALLRIVIRTPSAVNCCRKNRVQQWLALLTPVASPSQIRAAFVPMTATHPLTGQSGMNGHALRSCRSTVIPGPQHLTAARAHTAPTAARLLLGAADCRQPCRLRA